ncbi:hydroxyacid dehydrogenase [Halorubraceae archaeon YAN]|nr:hydroxyacid dehydrogenase [Halorubraceae archaeon YAN]
MVWNVLVPSHIGDAGPKSIEDIAEFTINSEDNKLDKNILKEIDAILLGGPTQVDSKFLDLAENLKVISKYGVGLDNVDIEAATEHNVIVANSPGSNALSVAEHAMALLLAVRRNVKTANQDLENGEWMRNKYISNELRGDVLGLLGCGNIASEVSRFAQAFGLQCITYDPYLTEYQIPPGVGRVDTKMELFEKADIISIHIPLNDETRHSVSEKELRALSEDGYLINTARGGIIDEKALIEFLEAGKIRGAGLDVFEVEPVSADNRLLELENVVATPHIGGATFESDQEKGIQAANNIRTVYNGNIPKSTVNIDGLFSTNL